MTHVVKCSVCEEEDFFHCSRTDIHDLHGLEDWVILNSHLVVCDRCAGLAVTLLRETLSGG